MFRVNRSFSVNGIELAEGEVLTVLDFLTRLHGINMVPFWMYLEPTSFYFARRYAPVIPRLDALHEDDFLHIGLEPIQQLNKVTLELLEAEKAGNVLGFDLAVAETETILDEIEAARKTAENKKPVQTKRAARTKKTKRARSIA